MTRTLGPQRRTPNPYTKKSFIPYARNANRNGNVGTALAPRGTHQRQSAAIPRTPDRTTTPEHPEPYTLHADAGMAIAPRGIRRSQSAATTRNWSRVASTGSGSRRATRAQVRFRVCLLDVSVLTFGSAFFEPGTNSGCDSTKRTPVQRFRFWSH